VSPKSSGSRAARHSGPFARTPRGVVREPRPLPMRNASSAALDQRRRLWGHSISRWPKTWNSSGRYIGGWAGTAMPIRSIDWPWDEDHPSGTHRSYCRAHAVPARLLCRISRAWRRARPSTSGPWDSARREPPDPQRTETIIQLATILSRRGKPDEAESYLREAVAVRLASDGADATTTAEAKVYLADFLNGVREDHTGAERLYREAIGTFRGSADASLGPLTHATSGLANATDALGRPKEAEDLLRGLVTLQRDRYGASHPSVANARESLPSFSSATTGSPKPTRYNVRNRDPEQATLRIATSFAIEGSRPDRAGTHREADSSSRSPCMREQVSGSQHAPSPGLADCGPADRQTLPEAEATLPRARHPRTAIP
jgi:hypothetical protein